MKKEVAISTGIILTGASLLCGYTLAQYNYKKQLEEDLLFHRLDNNFWEEVYSQPLVNNNLEHLIAREKATEWMYKHHLGKEFGEEVYRFVKDALHEQKMEYGNVGSVSKVDPLLIACLIYRESRFNPDVISSAGAVGFTQVMPLHLKNLKQAGIVKRVDRRELLNWKKNIRAGIFVLLSYAKSTDDLGLALMKYNAGPTRPYLGIRYAKKILNDYQEVITLWN